jgi:hypothetical protein
VLLVHVSSQEVAFQHPGANRHPVVGHDAHIPTDLHWGAPVSEDHPFTAQHCDDFPGESPVVVVLHERVSGQQQRVIRPEFFDNPPRDFR